MSRVRLARRLRRDMTDAERLLWSRLRGRRMQDHKFRRQMRIEGFVADFACVEAKVIIELDGGQHAFASKRDRRRTEIIGGAGYLVIRFWNEEVFTNMEGVLDVISATLALRAGQER